MINIICYDVLQADLINEMKKAKLSSILADEVESRKFKRFPICIRSVDKNINIPEEFSAFNRCEWLSVKVIETEIMQVLK